MLNLLKVKKFRNLQYLTNPFSGKKIYTFDNLSRVISSIFFINSKLKLTTAKKQGNNN